MAAVRSDRRSAASAAGRSAAAALPDVADRLRQLADQVEQLEVAEIVGQLEALRALVKLNGKSTRPRGCGSLRLHRRVWVVRYYDHGRRIQRSTGYREHERAEAETFLLRLLGQVTAWRLTTVELHALRGPVVYILKRGARVLYVGRSAQGLARPLSSRHHVLGRLAFDGSEELSVFPCESAAEAVAVEADLIMRMEPALNKRVVPLDRRTAGKGAL